MPEAVEARDEANTAQDAAAEPPTTVDPPEAKAPEGAALPQSSKSRVALAAGAIAIAVGLVALPVVLHAPAPAPAPVTAPASASAPALAFSATAPEAAPGEEAAHVWRVAELSSGAELLEIAVGRHTVHASLVGAGIAKAEAARVVEALDGVKKFPGASLTVARDKASGRVIAFEYATTPADVWQAREGEAGAPLVAKKLPLRVDRQRVAVAVTVGQDLRASVLAAGLDDDVLRLLDDALEGHAELSDLRPGARLRVVATEERVEGAFARYAPLEAVEYTPAHGGSALRVYWYERDSASKHKPRGGFYDEKGHQPFQGAYRSPVPLARVSSRFNMHRMHPVLHVVMPHNGVDFGAATGTPVYATAAGTVRSAGDGGACGNMVLIEHANGLVSGYCHLSRFAAGLHAGQHVEARQLIAYVGATGRVTGPHLHFLVKRGETFIDPMSLRLDGVRVLPRVDRTAFADKRAELDAALDAIALPSPPSPEVVATDGGPPEDEVLEVP